MAAASVVASSAATLSLLLALPLPAIPRAFVAMWICACALDAYRAVALRVGGRGVREVVLRVPDIEVTDGDGRLHEGVVRDGSFVSPWLTIVRWRPHGSWRDRTLVILPDMLEAEPFRAFRVQLKMN